MVGTAINSLVPCQPLKVVFDRLDVAFAWSVVVFKAASGGLKAVQVNGCPMMAGKAMQFCVSAPLTFVTHHRLESPGITYDSRSYVAGATSIFSFSKTDVPP